MKWFTKHLVSNFANDNYKFYALISDLFDYFDNVFNDLMLIEIYRYIEVRRIDSIKLYATNDVSIYNICSFLGFVKKCQKRRK